MPADDHSLDKGEAFFSREVDLGLGVPEGFTAAPLFPGDRILRLHPNWFILDFEREGDGFTARIKDYATEAESDLSGTMAFTGRGGQLIALTLDGEADTRICFFSKTGRLHVRLEARAEPAPTDPVLLWIKAVREYLRIYLKTTPATLFWRLVMNRIILTMNPSQRKICLMIARFTLLEVLVILLIVIGYCIFVL
ncbi:MAG: hypothetical protein HUN04_14705 [Desulfobacter sp.]|nr:MAG: hypothetical protein HUN04_14705 [Desulfobacter sp.]